MEDLGRSKQTFSRVMSPPETNHMNQSLLSFIFILIIAISPTNLSYTSKQLLVVDAVLRTPALSA